MRWAFAVLIVISIFKTISFPQYLDKKRVHFPRFFFISNDELLEILSETKDPLRIQIYLTKCFTGIFRLTFSETFSVESIQSAEVEVYYRPVYPFIIVSPSYRTRWFNSATQLWLQIPVAKWRNGFWNWRQRCRRQSWSPLNQLFLQLKVTGLNSWRTSFSTLVKASSAALQSNGHNKWWA